MFQLGISAACAYVRKSLDELTSVEDIGMLASPDAIDLHKIVENSIIEAAVRVHERASSILMEGVKGTQDTDYSATLNSPDLSVTITMTKKTVRVVSIKANDSEVVVTELIPEDSAEGRKQKNPHIRGTHDDPRVVLNKVWAGDHLPKMTYYSAKTSLPTFELEYVPYPEIDENTILICSRLEYAVLNELTAMVMDSFGLTERAALHRNKANEILNRN